MPNLRQWICRLAGRTMASWFPHRYETISPEQYFDGILRDPGEWVGIGAKSLSHDLVSHLLRRATRGEIDWQGLAEALSRRGDHLGDDEWNLDELLAALLLHCVISPTSDAFEQADLLLKKVVPKSKPADWAPEFRLLAYQVASISNDEETLRQLDPYCDRLPGVLWAARTDLLRPSAEEMGFDVNGELNPQTVAWWENVNEPFVKDGIEPWELIPEQNSDEPFAWIHAPQVEGCAVPEGAQVLISVIVPVYNPDHGFSNTIESLVRQSWSNLEILIVDDASITGADFIEQALQMDPRVRVLKMDRNAGAYAARNAGFEAALGEFVTVLDADDLSHSRRIELQVMPLLETPEKVASGIAGIRLYADGSLTMYGFYTSRRNYSAFLFRREPVLRALGRFDDVRKSGDVEFLGRLQVVFGTEAVHQVRKHLSIVQLTSGSLSRNDVRYVWLAGERVAYFNQYRGWHRSLSEGGDLSQLRLLENRGRPFVAPAKFTDAAQRQHFGIAVLRDWSESVEGIELADLIDRIPEARNEQVGLLNGVHPRLSGPGRENVKSSIWRSVEDGSADWLSWGQHATIDTLVISDPEYALVLPDREFNALTVRSVKVIRRTPFERLGSSRAIVDPDWILSRCSERFGAPAEWIE